MNNKKTLALALLSSMALSSLAQAAGPNCLNVGYAGGGIISPTQPACPAAVLKSLSNSNQFPDIFAVTPAKTLGICYLSQAPIQATIGITPVLVTTSSAWTNDYLTFVAVPDDLTEPAELATVVTEWVISEAQHPHKALGNLYTHDTINLTTGVELDLIVGGTGRYDGAHGALQLQSYPAGPTDIGIASINGAICVPSDH